MQVLRQLPTFNDPNLVLGYDALGDAGVYALNDRSVLVQTVDILTPIVDDPYTFGAIAAANSLSDVFAMGARPLTALNILCFPPNKLSPEIIGELIRGGSDIIKEAGAVIVGGHSVKDEELKYGLAVTGITEKNRLITNSRAKPGDSLILTKPIGTGVISTALKAGRASAESRTAMTASMCSLNKTASEIMVKMGAHACTDITGFGLLGHALTLSRSSNINLTIIAGEVPLLPGADEYAMLSLFPGGSSRNFDYVAPHVEWDSNLTEKSKMLLCDAQTSGGLMIAIEKEKAGKLVDELHANGISAARIIGHVDTGNPLPLHVV